MSFVATDEALKILLAGSRKEPLEKLEETSGEWVLWTLSISKHRPVYSDGWTHDLRPESRFYKRWFDFPDIGKCGWAIMLHVFDPVDDRNRKCEQFPGWVPPERVAEADHWIELLNAEIRDRFASKKP
jgi:hypothetical protein